MRRWFLNFQAVLFKRKMIVKSLLASLLTVTNPDYCSESRIKISVPAFHCFHWSVFSSVHVIVGFRNNFLNHRRLSEQSLESQAANWKPEARRKLFLIFSSERKPNILKLSAIMQKVLIWLLGPLTKTFISWHYLFTVLFHASLFISFLRLLATQDSSTTFFTLITFLFLTFLQLSVMLFHWLVISCPLCRVTSLVVRSRH
jgi:hypothetical protein